MKKFLLILFSFVAFFGGVNEGFGQCANIGGQGSGISPGAGCAPHDENFTAFFNITNLTATNVQFRMDWGDGTIETFDLTDPEMTTTAVSAIVTRFDLDAIHTYGSGTVCLYEPTANLILDGVLCTEAQTQNAVVWDTDNNNGGVVDLVPEEYEVCAGSEVTVTFTDATLFNCVPPAYMESNPNFFQRHYAFEYGTISTVADIEIDGTVETYPYYDGTVFFNNNGDLVNDGQVTSNIFVPATAAVGQQFEVTLYYWNICNPFNGNNAAPNFADAETDVAVITIVPPPDPQPQVFDPAENHATNAGNNAFWYGKTDPVQTFCADETVFFRQGPTGAPGGIIAWDFDWDGDPANFNNDAGGGTTNTFYDAATYAGTTVQVGMRITRGDVGTPCIFYDTLTIDIAAGPIADFDITPDDISCETITFSTTNNSTNADGYTWSISQVFGPAGTIEDISTQNTNTVLTDVTITGPGRYRVSLTATSTTAVSCPNTTTRDIRIFDNPIANFSATEVCEGDVTTFTNLSNIPTIINGDAIETWEFVFDFDSTDYVTDPAGTFDAQTITTLQAGDFAPGYDTLYTVAGEYKVALRVTTRGDRGACVSAVDTATVIVKANPLAAFDFDATYATANGIDYSQPICPGVPIALINNSPAGQTNPGVDRYYVEFISQDGANDLIFPPTPGDFGGPGTIQVVDPLNALSPLPNPFSAANYTYDIYFIAVGDNNCDTRVGPLQITLLPEDNAGFNIFEGDPDLGAAPYDPGFFYCSPQEFYFETDATTKAFNADEYIWTITDGGTGDTLLFPLSVIPDGSIANERINFNFVNAFPNVNVKQFNIELEVISNNFCISNASRTVRVFPQPTADFNLTDVIAICDSVTFRFEALQSSVDYTWSVTATDPSKISSTLENNNFYIVNLERPLNGETDLDFTVELFTTNLVGCVSETVTFDSTVFKAEDIIVDINFVPNNATSCLPAEFDLQNTTNPATIPAGVTWAFEISRFDSGIPGYVVIETIEGSDQVLGNEDFSTAIPYEFTTPGDYRLDLIATAQSNCVFGLGTPRDIAILETPEVNFNLDLNQGCGPLEVGIIDNSSSTQNFDIFYSVFNPFDGTTTNGPIFTGNSGPLDGEIITGLDNTSGDTINYEISLIAQNALGCSDTLTRVVAVYPRPQIDFELVSDSIACSDNYEFEFGITLNDTPPGTVFRWNFGNGTGLVDSLPNNQIRTYINPNGTSGPIDYIVTLIAQTPEGCTDTATNVITLNPDVRAGFFKTVNSGCSPLDVNIFGNAQGTGISGNYTYEKRLQGTTPWLAFDSIPNANGDVIETFTNSTAANEIYEIRQIVFSDIGNGVICSDTAAIQEVTVFPLPATPTITGPNQVCENETSVVYSVPHIAGNSYIWLVPSFSFISSFNATRNQVTVTFGATPPEANPSVRVIVRSPNFCLSDTSELPVDIVTGPNASLSLAGPGTICPGESTFLQVNLTGPGTMNFDVIIYDGFENDTLRNIPDGYQYEIFPTASSNYRIREVIDREFPGCPGTVSPDDERVNVNIAPIATLSGNATICEGATTNLRINMSGLAPWDVTYTDGTTPVTVSSNSSVLLIPVSPVVNTVYSLVNVSDASCTGVVDTAQANIQVNPAPGGSIFVQDDDGEVCINTPIGLGFVLNGNGPWTVRYQDDDGNIFAISDIQEGADHGVNGFTIHLFEVIPQKQITDYTIVDIVDVNGCPGPGNGTATVTTLPVPILRMTDNSTICEGESANLVFNFPDGVAPFTVDIAINDVDDTLRLTNIPNGHVEVVTPTQTTNYRAFSVIDANGCPAYDLGLPVRVRVRTRPTVMLEGQDSICYGESTPLTFTSTGVGPWTITYTDGTSNFTFTTPFNRHFEDVTPLVSTQYTVVSISDANTPACSNTGTGMAEIIVASELIANFTATPENMSLPDRTVTITNTTTNKNDWSYTWDFGDGNISTAVDPAPHVYDTYGTYFLRMTATDGECTDIAQTIITIEAIPAIVDFVGDPIEGCLPLTVNFENLTLFAEDSSYLWDFGDNQSARVINPIHTYTRPGVYTVRLSANNITGVAQQEEKIQYIRVFDTPQADFSVRNGFEQVFTGERVEFSNSSTSANQYLWNFGDGNESTDFEPVHVYADSGIYDIQLVAINTATGCADTLLKRSQVLVLGGGEVRVANAFTPSRGGPGTGSTDAQRNDFFIPQARGVSQYDLKIYNRWGELLFESKDQQVGWDGYYKGELMPMGVYVYRLELQYENGRREVKLGDVTLIR